MDDTGQARRIADKPGFRERRRDDTQARLSTIIEQISTLGRRLDGVNTKVEQVDTRVEKVEADIVTANDHLDAALSDIDALKQGRVDMLEAVDDNTKITKQTNTRVDDLATSTQALIDLYRGAKVWGPVFRYFVTIIGSVLVTYVSIKVKGGL